MTPRHLFPHRRGSVVVTACIAMPILLGIAVLVVDLGVLMTQSQRLKDVADLAALAGAGEPIGDHLSDVNARILQSVDANRQNPLPIAYDPSEIVFYQQGSTVPGYGRLPDDAEAVTVCVRCTVPAYFGRAIGLTGRRLMRRSTALRLNVTDQAYVLFANRMTLYGGSNTFSGRVHTNDSFRTAGPNNRFLSMFQYAGELVPGNSIFSIPPDQIQARPLPISLTEDDFLPYDYELSNFAVNQSNSRIPPGVYRVHGAVSINGSGCILENVTFIADGKIAFNGSHMTYSPARFGIFAYSLSRDSRAIAFSGSGSTGVGALYAPDGGIAFCGSDTTVVETTIVADTIAISGSGSSLQATPGLRCNTGIRLID